MGGAGPPKQDVQAGARAVYSPMYTAQEIGDFYTHFFRDVHGCAQGCTCTRLRRPESREVQLCQQVTAENGRRGAKNRNVAFRGPNVAFSGPNVAD